VAAKWGISGPFFNVSSEYWYRTEYPGNSDAVVGFHFNCGGVQDTDGKDFYNGKYYTNYAWAVRETSPVPEPATILLLGTGLIGLAGVARKRRGQLHG